jgi:hypothetical protein
MQMVLWRFVKLLLRAVGLLAAFLLAGLAFALAWPAMLTAGVTLWLSRVMDDKLDDWERMGIMIVAFFTTVAWTVLILYWFFYLRGVHTPL